MRYLFVFLVLIASGSVRAENWAVTADEACIPDLRPAEDSIERGGAVFDALEADELTLAVDGDADGRGDLLLRLRPEASEQAGLLRELVAEATGFKLHAWGSAAMTVELVQLSGPSIWLPVRTPNCPLPDDWVADRELMMLESMAWMRTADGPELEVKNAPTLQRLAEIHQLMGHSDPAVCRAGGPGALSCAYSLGSGACHAACASPNTYACCAPAGCGCESAESSAGSGRVSGPVP